MNTQRPRFSKEKVGNAESEMKTFKNVFRPLFVGERRKKGREESQKVQNVAKNIQEKPQKGVFFPLKSQSIGYPHFFSSSHLA